MGKHFEFHFIEAPYVVLEEGDEEGKVDAWTRAAILASRVSALETDKSYSLDGQANDKESMKKLQELIDLTKRKLGETDEGRQISRTSQQEDIEGLVARKTGRSLSRNWVTPNGLDNEKDMTGVQLALAQIGDYMRENGTVSEGGREQLNVEFVTEQSSLSVSWCDRIRYGS
jgi:hypothetical protein